MLHRLRRFALVCASVATTVGALASCESHVAPARPHGQWLMGVNLPAFDPEGPPDPTRGALERLLTRGLVEEDAEGRVTPAAALRVDVSADSLVYTFHLPAAMRFSDDSPCNAGDFRTALIAGLERADHSTRRWQLAAVKGVDAIRPGRPLPAGLGIEAPDPATLRLRLAVPDPLLLQKLAVPGTTYAWKSLSTATWNHVVGLGPYRVVAADSTRRLELVRTPDPVVARGAAATARAAGADGSIGSIAAVPDTLTLRFTPSAARVRALLRAGRMDLVWPLPPGMADEPTLAGYRMMTRDARPLRWLMLVLRTDVPPTSKLPARHALAHGINKPEVMRALGEQAAEFESWLPGAPAFDFPALDPQAIEQWRDAGKLGRSFHVVMAYDAFGPGANVARVLQGEWSTHAIYVELRPLTGPSLQRELLAGSSSQLALAEVQALIDAPEGALAPIVMPYRGAAVGAVRSGWRTREFDPWLTPGARRPAGPLDDTWAQHRVEEERIVLPLSRLRWSWIERSTGAEPPFHPRFGPLPPIVADAQRR